MGSNEPAMTSTAIESSIIQQWMTEKLDVAKVEQRLATLNLEEDSKTEYLQAFKKLRNEQRQFKGFIILGAGAFIGFISCLLSIFNPIPEYYYHILYGLTSIAVAVIFIGLYFVFE
ncbi:MAG: hypothetical protein ACXWV5_09915 [Flavitalea sp.]